MDFFFDNGIIFIAVAIVIGRLILQFRRKGGEGGEKPPSQAPRFFEEEEEDDEAEEIGRRIVYSQTRGSSDFLRELVMRETAAATLVRPPPEPVLRPEPEIRPAAPQPPPAEPTGRPSRAESSLPGSRAAGFPASLNRLSPMRQAVILAEILGPPKGL
jgi:hypothetical protein